MGETPYPGRVAETHKDIPVLTFRTQAAHERWLAKHHASDGAVWLKFAKKGSEARTLTYEQAREAAIIWGWIDGLINKWDDDYCVRRFTRRRSRSKWSKINREIAEGLIAEGRMAAPGLEQVEAAKGDGRWDQAYAGSAEIEEPEDFLAALARSRKASAFYPTISRAARYSILFQILDAKRPETRKRRIERFVKALAKGERP